MNGINQDLGRDFTPYFVDNIERSLRAAYFSIRPFLKTEDAIFSQLLTLSAISLQYGIVLADIVYPEDAQRLKRALSFIQE